ncbi:RagB/SusD family nutrient uptake outer membrane protein [Carboxylicivirga sp. RSCT41]|uniref:RagB/SusD family nutrient uptake outer membrane protein n=1 Tax=Carboxylicivirga agarovorans TaxID=3417570 RepID=UPI003D338FD5
MKKYIIYIIVLVFTSGLTSCEDWFDVQPKTQVKTDDLFDSEGGFKRALIGVYTQMAGNSAYGAEGTLAFIEVLSGAYTSVRDNNHNYFEASWYNYESSANVSRIDNLWAVNYSTIANINNLLEHIDEKQSVFNEGIYEIIKGEALALRAYIHFDLLRNFAPAPINGLEVPAIPYVDAVSTSPFPQLSVGEVLERVIDDLLEAEMYLKDHDPIGPAFDSYEESRYGYTSVDESISESSFLMFRKERMNYYAVLGTLARVYLYRGGDEDKTEAYKYANDVINCEKFALNDSQTISEQSSNQIAMTYLAQEYLFSLYNRNMTESVNEKYFKFVETSSSYDELEIDEPRRNEYFETEKYGGVADVRLNKLFTINTDGLSYYLAKYDYGNYNVKRVPLIKVSEMYLIIAECMDSWEHLMSLRRMRGLKVMAPGASLKEEIEAEYRKELLGEGQMFYYYKRLNQLVNVDMEDLGKFVLPIPDVEKERGLIN